MRPAKDYLKKIKDKQLKEKFKEALSEIRKTPNVGQTKIGDLAGIYGYDIRHKGVSFEIAYLLSEDKKGEIIVVIMAGTRENFWDVIKKYI